ncbi:LuxR C-terminal-related transcriptional regulator [Streptomyces sp. NPDC050560]|uniref:helix-turn-helix transcriptional regulator n=1 Tax=Streptomyces sp. NPDC050560 TaxID=3365630 RepID=UPI0037A4C9BD
MIVHEVTPCDDGQQGPEAAGEAAHGHRLTGLPVSRTRIAIHEGDPLTRAGVAHHIAQERDMTAVRQPAGVPGASAAATVAVVLLDRLDAAAAVRLRKLAAECDRRVVLVVDELDERQVELVLEAGIHTIVWRHQATAAHLVKAIRAARRDESDIPADLLRRLMAQLGRRAHGTELSTLAPGRPTARELSVLEYVAHGLGTKEIAARLSYSERTVKGILHDVMMRLNLRNRAHAVAYAIREGYI